MQDFTIIQWTTLALAAAAVVLNLFALRRNAATNRRIDRLPKPAWMGKWPPTRSDFINPAYDYSHLPPPEDELVARAVFFAGLRSGEDFYFHPESDSAAQGGATPAANRIAAEHHTCALPDEAGQGIGDGARQDEQHLNQRGLQPSAPAALVQVVLPINEGDSALRSQSNAIDEQRDAASGNTGIREESRGQQLLAGAPLRAFSLQVLKLHEAMALSHLQNAHVQRQIDRLVFDVSHLDCPVCGGQQRRGEGDNSTGIGTALPGMDSTGAYPDEVANNSGPSTTHATPSAP
ncbi:MAG: hypothetical protein FH747_06650 [Stenotrophomonas sp.]|uniref:hypothetical protein n=1 Tax=Stenotrophomonas sp. TaxID=69392 RepID=UPI001353CF4B|nr:hypothetical protein [Stenotrophomonas sp.]MTI73326.1 hypothetical protein [Stenotrophomonas sp.]